MGTYERGDVVLYRQRDGSLVEAKVVSVDKAVQPFSYGIQLEGGIRETEASRLTPNKTPSLPQTSPKPPVPTSEQYPSKAQPPTADADKGFHAAASAAAGVGDREKEEEEEEDDDDFGDFSGPAESHRQPNGVQQQQHHFSAGNDGHSAAFTGPGGFDGTAGVTSSQGFGSGFTQGAGAQQWQPQHTHNFSLHTPRQAAQNGVFPLQGRHSHPHPHGHHPHHTHPHGTYQNAAPITHAGRAHAANAHPQPHTHTTAPFQPHDHSAPLAHTAPHQATPHEAPYPHAAPATPTHIFTAPQAHTAPPHPAALDSDDDFGDFEDAVESQPSPGSTTLPTHNILNPSCPAQSAPSTSYPTNAITPSASQLPHSTAWSSGAQMNNDFNEGDFGDFAQAAASPAAKADVAPDRNAPLSMSLFGEEDEGSEDPELPQLAVGLPWGGLLTMSQPLAGVSKSQSQPHFSHTIPLQTEQRASSTDHPSVSHHSSQQLSRQSQQAQDPPAAWSAVSQQMPGQQLPPAPPADVGYSGQSPAVNQQLDMSGSQPLDMSLPLPQAPQPGMLPYAPAHSFSDGLASYGGHVWGGEEEEEEDDFGDFEGVPHMVEASQPLPEASWPASAVPGAMHLPEREAPAVEKAILADRSLPLSLSLFGQEEAEHTQGVESKDSALMAMTWPPAGPYVLPVPQPNAIAALIDSDLSSLQSLPSALPAARQAADLPAAPNHSTATTALPLSSLALAPGISDSEVDLWGEVEESPNLNQDDMRQYNGDEAVQPMSREQALLARVEAWGQLLQICAEELELGRSIWEAHAAADSLESFCSTQSAQHYLMGLGNVRFASCALASAVRHPSLSLASQSEYLGHIRRCSSAWDAPTEGAFGMTLHQAACEACESCGAPGLGPLLATASLDETDLERLPHPEPGPGRCHFTLLPLKRLPSAPTTTWRADSDARCLEALAQLWLHRISPDLPAWLIT